MTKIYIINSNADAYGLAKKIASQKYNIDISILKIVRGHHGKPYFENLPDFHFNISHSGDLKVLAVSHTKIGVDIEKIREVSLKVSNKFCEQEYSYISEADSLYRFFEIWTKKEAYLKYTGTGLCGGLNTFNTLEMDIPLKTIAFSEYLISICGTDNFKIIDLR